MNYWLVLFTGTTWEEFRSAGAQVSGFRERMRSQASRVKPGDIFICYLTGVKHWIGALEVLGPSQDQSAFWKQETFPVRFAVRPIIMLDPEYGVPMEDMEGKLSFYTGANDRGKYKGFVRMSPNLFRYSEDAQLILEMLHKAQKSPVRRKIDQKKLARLPSYPVERRKGKHRISATVTIPASDEIDIAPTSTAPALAEQDSPEASRHTQIQYILLRLGSDMGLNVWVARNDRSKTYNGQQLGTITGILPEIPTQFNDATNRTIELIDVLWLRGNSIVAAFEVECTTSIYSGLLRMSDLVALQPNLDIKLYLVAPDERRDKVEQEIRRPTFTLRERPLPEICGFISFSALVDKAEGIQRLGLASSLKPDFLEATAEYFGEDGI